MTITDTRYQDAVPFRVENRLTQAVKALAGSKPMPIKHVIAVSPGLGTWRGL